MNQDTVLNLYDFPAREYGIQGRWPSPDPAGFAAAHLSNPQSWNRFSYVRNSPENLIDPSGLDSILPFKTANHGRKHPRSASTCHRLSIWPDKHVWRRWLYRECGSVLDAKPNIAQRVDARRSNVRLCWPILSRSIFPWRWKPIIPKRQIRQ